MPGISCRGPCFVVDVLIHIELPRDAPGSGVIRKIGHEEIYIFSGTYAKKELPC
jgi:hypothetical protein